RRGPLHATIRFVAFDASRNDASACRCSVVRTARSVRRHYRMPSLGFAGELASARDWRQRVARCKNVLSKAWGNTRMKKLFALVALSAVYVAAIAESPRPEDTEVWEPIPKLVTPGATPSDPPADAIVLFDGKTTNGWESVDGGPAKWIAANGALTVAPGTGDIRTVEKFGDVQLHIEWRTPQLPPEKTGQDRGNSGVFLQERYEVQILDTLENRTYSNGQAGSIYKQYIPLVNAARPAGEWQSYDI